MPKWLQKSLVVLITVLTFGLVTPPQTLFLEKLDVDKSLERDTRDENTSDLIVEQSFVEDVEDVKEDYLQVDKQKWVQLLLREAENQAFTKFGQKIKPVIEDEFRQVILPNVEKAITLVAEQYPDEDLANLAMSEIPGKGMSEKIFHITDMNKGSDVIRFHVRRDHPPLQGYWFNFHYHTYHDKFQEHHDLGAIYWAKNTPPKWMS